MFGKKIIILSLITVMLIGIASFFFVRKARSYNIDSAFGQLFPREKLDKITSLRDAAIEGAVARGDYRCCIDPPCTMCYLEANQWNNYAPGTCACDDLIAEGKESCPQCQRGLSVLHNADNTYCDIHATASTCK